MEEKETNYFRFHRLCIRLGTKVVREKFNQILPPCDLPTKLAARRALVNSIRGMINQKQKDLLYPTSGTTSSDTFDLTLMMFVLWNVAGVAPPSSGINTLPGAMDTSLGADLVRIKFYRNQLAHAEKTELELNIFEKIWTELSEAIVRIGGLSWQSECDKIKNMMWTRDELDGLHQDFIELQRTVNNEICLLKDQISELQQKCSYCDCHDIHGLELNAWEEDDKTFVDTKVVDHILHMLETGNVITLIGQPGIGKSAAAHHVALGMMKQNRYTVIPCRGPKEIIQHYRSGTPHLFVIDDVFGKYTLCQNDLEDWIKYKSNLKEIFRSGTAKLIVTCRHEVFQEKQCERVPIIVKNTCDMSSEQYRLSKNEKVEIAKCFFNENIVSQIIPYVDRYYFFPLICKMYKKSPTEDVVEFFKNPFDVVKKQLDRLEQQHEKTKFCSLLLLVLRGGFVKEIDIMSENLRNVLEKVFVACGVNYGTPTRDIHDHLESLCKSYLVKETRVSRNEKNVLSEEVVYTTIHDKICDFLCCYFGNKFQELILEFGDENLLLKRCVLDLSNTNSSQFKIVLNKKFEDVYITKIIDFLCKGMFVEVMGQGNMRNKSFEQKLVEKIRERNEMNDLLVRRDSCGRTLLYLVCKEKLSLLASFLIEHTKNLRAECFSDFPPLVAACESGVHDIVKALLGKGTEVNKSDLYGQYPITMAVKSRSTIIVDFLIQRRANINVINYDGYSPLFLACELGCPEIVILLSDAGINFSRSVTKKKVTPLIRASTFGQTSVVRLLIKKGANIHQKDLTGMTPLLFAVYNGHKDTSQCLIEAGADPKATDSDERNALSLACCVGCLPIVQYLIENIGMDLHQCDVYGRSLLWHTLDGMDESGNNLPLLRYLLSKEIDVCKPNKDLVYPVMLACEKGNLEVVKLICDNGGGNEINKKDINGQTPLMIAVGNGHACVSDYLISKGADINKANNFGETALMVACERLKTNCIKVILTKTVPVDTLLTDEKGRTPLIHACMTECDYCDHIQPLVQYGWDVNQADNLGRTALMWACFTGNVSAIQFLLSCHADVHANDIYGNSALFYAILAINHNCYDHTNKGKLDTQINFNKDSTTPLTLVCNVQNLISKGASINMRNMNGTTPLMVACTNCNWATVKLLIDKGANINVTDKDGTTPLMFACTNGNEATITLLIDKGANINVADKYGKKNLLLLASEMGWESTVKLLIDKGDDINVADNVGTTPLMFAFRNNWESTAQLLIDKGADINIADNVGTTPLMFAFRNNWESTAQLLIDKGADINIAYKYGITPLMLAIEMGLESTVKLLIDKGADINIADNVGTTPLMFAFRNNWESTAQLLIDKGADINIADNVSTPLMFAFRNNWESTAQLLIDKGADINVADNDGTTPLMFAFRNNWESTAQLLIDKGADINVADNDGTTPLMFAFRNNWESTAQLLIDKGADINVADNDGITPLMLAIEMGLESTVKLLIDKGADINIADNVGTTPLMFACTNGNEATITLLIDKGANINVADKYGKKNLLLLASEMGWESTVKLLIDKGDDINVADNVGTTPLMFAFRNNWESTAQLLIDKGADINIADNVGTTPLMFAFRNNWESTAQLLIDKGADINIAYKYGITPLMLAIEMGLESTVKLLIDKGADINIADNVGTTPLMFAFRNNWESTAQLLIDKGADINIADNVSTPLMFAFRNNWESTAQLLIDKGADINVADNDGTTPLMFAFRNNWESTAQLLIDKGATYKKRKYNPTIHKYVQRLSFSDQSYSDS